MHIELHAREQRHVAEHQGRTDYARNNPNRNRCTRTHRSHYNAICIHTLQHTKGEPVTPETIQTATAHTRYLPFIAACSHVARNKLTLSCSGFLPNTSLMHRSCSHFNAFCSTTYTSMQPLQCDSHPRFAEHQGRT